MNDMFSQWTGAEWKRTRQGPDRLPADEPGQFWDPAVTPPFPVHWPPEGGSGSVRYLYATCFDPRIADGIRVAAPWGIIESLGCEQGLRRFVRLSESIREIGIQGVRPMTKEEMAVYEKCSAAESFLESLAGLPDEDDPVMRPLRDYYLTWCGHNGVIRQEIAYRHEPFFRWVGCLR